MTEEEAKTKWCPFARVVFRDKPPAYNRSDPGWAGSETMMKNTACIGSTCMAWRWEHVADLAETRNGHPGYCGLAGKP